MAVEFTKIGFVCYNILSPNLAKPSHHSNSAPEVLENSGRFSKIKAKLEAEIKNGAIIALQEVSEKWANELTVFFIKNKYHCCCRNYGSTFNGYMGVMLAFPEDLYELEHVVSKKITDTAYWPDDPRHEKFNNREYSKKTLKTLDNAGRRWNSVLIFQLKSKFSKKSFVTATYHMPCMYSDQKFMDIHAGLLVRFVQETAKGLPCILAGDFNSKPESSAYGMITSGRPTSLVASMFHNHRDPDKITFGEDYREANKQKNKNKKGKGKGKGKGKAQEKDNDRKSLKIKRDSQAGTFTNIMGMRSAYKAFLKEEPKMTNYSNHTKDPKGGFADCIDYIFITEEFEVVDVLPLYEGKDTIKSPSFPDENEPSDHIMLRVLLKL